MKSVTAAWSGVGYKLLYAVFMVVVAVVETDAWGQEARVDWFIAIYTFNGIEGPDFIDIGFGEDDRLYIPAAPIFVQAEGTAEVDGVASLFVENKATGNRLLVDLVAETVTVNGDTRQLRPDEARVQYDQIFVSDALLSDVFDLEFRFESLGQFLEITANRPWPRDLRVARERRWRMMGIATPNEIPPDITELQRQALGRTLRGDLDINTATGTTGDLSRNHNLRLVNEAAWLTNQLFLSGSDDDLLSSARIESGRRDPRGGIFGFEDLYEFRVGDVSGLSVPLAGGTGGGRGVRVLAEPLDRPQQFDTTVFQGDAPPGWDAELLINGRLFDFVRIGEDGRFRFEDIPLGFGQNVLTVKLYGPDGEEREIVRDESLGGSIVPPGETWWSAAFVESGRSVFSPNGSSKEGPLTGSFRVDRSLFGVTGLSLQGARVPFPAASPELDPLHTEDYLGIGLDPQVPGPVRLAGNMTQSISGGRAYSFRGAAELGFTTLSVSREQYGDDFFSPSTGVGKNALESRTRIGTSLPLGFGAFSLGRIGVRLSLDEARDGSQSLVERYRYNQSLGLISLQHRLDRRTSETQDGMESAPSGDYRVVTGWRQDGFSLRGEARWRAFPEWEYASTQLSGTWRPDLDNTFRATVSGSQGNTSFSLGYDRRWRFDLYSLGFGVSANDAGEVNAGLNLRSSFDYTPDEGVSFFAEQYGTRGRARIRVLERGPDGELVPVPGVRLRVDEEPVEAFTDAEGEIVLRDLPVNRGVDIAVDESTLPDFFYAPVNPRQQVWPRPGVTVPLDVIIADTLVLTGRVLVEDENGNPRGVGNTRVQVLDEQGRVYAETVTLADGYYSFETLPYGDWAVRVAPGQSGTAGRLPDAAYPLEALYGELEVAGHDLRFTRRGAPMFDTATMVAGVPFGDRAPIEIEGTVPEASGVDGWRVVVGAIAAEAAQSVVNAARELGERVASQPLIRNDEPLQRLTTGPYPSFEVAELARDDIAGVLPGLSPFVRPPRQPGIPATEMPVVDLPEPAYAQDAEAAVEGWNLYIGLREGGPGAESVREVLEGLGEPIIAEVLGGDELAQERFITGPYGNAAAADAARRRVADALPELSPFVRPPARPGVAPAPEVRAQYAVQVGAVGQLTDAFALQDELQAAGFDVFLVDSRVGGRDLIQVRVGPVAGRAAAEALAGRVRERLGQRALVVVQP
ncbi:SPOR domain-containing protein [Spiribacter roseus]|uniref:SPOR domain-containing protein n=1 Tax=Spiribacter roseus TaxID=1855875 RepID=A0ABV3RX94_9GAMM